MALTDESMVMPVAPMGNNNGFGGFGGDCSWWLIIFLLMFGWGGYGNGGLGGGYDGGFGLYPWMNQNNQINDGFRDQMLNSSINGIQSAITSGFGDTALGIAGINQNICQTGNGIQNAINQGFANTNLGMCNGFNGVNASINGAQNALAQQMYSNEIANLNRSFAEQTANMQGFTGVNTGVADLKYTIAAEECATRNNSTMNTRDLLTAFTNGIQSIKDQLCEYRNDQKDETIANLRQELMFSRGQASQVEQTAQLLANNNAQTALFQQGLNNEVDALYNRLNNCPVSTVPVYGKQPIFTCNGNNSCGCGMA